ncbi:hypothetical protein DM01DRAFT_1341003 [Hesseltinella vesiculosa]|uniref:Amino acid transporter transmembrane domain-containing protein n=1 Tax=Hesseltinella vesiculosa TaxID=101127 RepID=A0A1X2G2B3_9FUNG|nr:hypothetical protein DM01DRAFT_1341003 [Hesseltinella vesiculosa]
MNDITAEIAPAYSTHQQLEPWQRLSRNVSNEGVLSSIICVVAGTGLLGIPYALSRSGWIGCFFLIFNACISQYTGVLIIRCLYLYPDSPRLDGFPEIGLATFGKCGQIIAFVFSHLLLLGTPIVYFILASGNIQDLLNLAGMSFSFKLCTWLVSVLVGLPFLMARHMRDVTWMSLIGTLASVLLLLVVTVATFHDFPTEAHHTISNPRQIPLAMSTFTFAYCGNVIYPHIEGSMKEPRHWPKVMLVATIIVALMYSLVGFSGYMVYGDGAQNPIFLNLSQVPAQMAANLLVTIHVLLTSPLYLFVFTVRIESWLGLAMPMPEIAWARPTAVVEKRKTSSPAMYLPRLPVMEEVDETDTEPIAKNKSTIQAAYWLMVQRMTWFFQWLGSHIVLARMLLRSLEICVCALVAMLIPDFSKVMTLVGTVAAEALLFILPCIFFIKQTLTSPSPSTANLFEVALCTLIALFGFVCIIFGTIDTFTLLFV